MSFRIKGLLTAFRTLTIISWPGREDENLSGSLPWFPVVGLAIGAIMAAISYLWMIMPLKTWVAGLSAILVIIESLITRGLHLDGLADWADSTGCLLGRDKKLEIMRDSRLGSFGVVALILALMMKLVIFERIISSGSVIWFMPALIISRTMMVELITTMPYARSCEGMAGSFIKGSSPGHRLASHLVSLVLCLFFGPVGLILFGTGWVMACGFRSRFKRVFGGITGDLLGTANECLEISLLFLCALVGVDINPYTGWGWVI